MTEPDPCDHEDAKVDILTGILSCHCGYRRWLSGPELIREAALRAEDYEPCLAEMQWSGEATFMARAINERAGNPLLGMDRGRGRAGCRDQDSQPSWMSFDLRLAIADKLAVWTMSGNLPDPSPEPEPPPEPASPTA